MKNATFRQLRVFSEVARHLSFTKAAQALHLTPPAVTMQVKELEGHVGLPLFERSGRNVSLTTPGEYMLVYARRMLATLKDAEDAAARLQQVEAGTLDHRHGQHGEILPAAPAGRVPARARGAWRSGWSKATASSWCKLLQANDVDVAVMGRPPKELATRTEPFAAHPHVFVAPVDHPLVKESGPHSAESLRPFDFIVREQGSGTRAALEKFLEQAHLEPRVIMEMGSNETIKQAVMAGMGISFLSLHTLQLELDNGLLALLDVDGSPVVRAWNVVHTLSKVLSPAAEAFRYFVLERGEAYLAQHFAAHLRLLHPA